VKTHQGQCRGPGELFEGNQQRVVPMILCICVSDSQREAYPLAFIRSRNKKIMTAVLLRLTHPCWDSTVPGVILQGNLTTTPLLPGQSRWMRPRRLSRQLVLSSQESITPPRQLLRAVEWHLSRRLTCQDLRQIDRNILNSILLGPLLSNHTRLPSQSAVQVSHQLQHNHEGNILLLHLLHLLLLLLLLLLFPRHIAQVIDRLRLQLLSQVKQPGSLMAHHCSSPRPHANTLREDPVGSQSSLVSLPP
jgi:hypothetical protein